MPDKDIYEETHEEDLGEEFLELEKLANEKFIILLKIIKELEDDTVFALNNKNLLEAFKDFKKSSIDYAKIIKQIKMKLIYLSIDINNKQCLDILGSEKEKNDTKLQ